MIGRLRGEIVYKQPPYMMVDVDGVGYELELPLAAFYDMPAQGEPVTLSTHLAIRDDAHVLYGFANESDRTLFRSLLKVSGVGAKMALAILSGMNSDEFANCIHSADSAALVRIPGIGKKTAERLIVEMRDRLDKLELKSGGMAINKLPARGAVENNPVSDAVGALIALGYKPNEASRMVRSINNEGLTSEEIIRQALKSMAVS